MRRHRPAIALGLLAAAGGFALWATRAWEGWEHIGQILGKGANLPIAGMVPVIALFTLLALREARHNDRLARAGREREILEQMRR
ncbi:MAG: hypothetical protein HY744_22345 [Deltaproteobacteria bacterium]|nr:hypothetical protein [Deltaproteobacteria bacterium]